MPRAKTIAIFSTKGGTGKTFLAANLAVSLASSEQVEKVCALDFDLHVIANMQQVFNLQKPKTGLDFIETIKRNPEFPALNLVNRISSAGIDFLPAVLRPRQVSEFSPSYIPEILSRLESVYDYIIVDSGTAFSDALLAIFNNSNLILLVTTPDIFSVYQTKWTLDTLQSLGFPLKMVKIVLNRAESVGGIAWKEIKAAIPCEVISHIPSEGKAVGFALNQRVPVVMNSPRAGVSMAIKNLARDLTRKADLYVEHVDIESSRLKEAAIPKEMTFWQTYGLAESYTERKEDSDDEVVRLKKRIHQRLIEELDLKRMEVDLSDPEKAKQVRLKTEQAIANAMARETGAFLSNTEVRSRLIKEIADEALGLGPLEDLLGDSDISDIMVNGKDEIYIERHGKLELTTKRFISDDQVRHVIERIIAPLGRRIDESQPMVDARLPDGSRVNAIIPPLSLTGPVLTIRKFGKERLTIDDLIKMNSLNEEMKKFLHACVLSRRNIIISGGTGSGKTTTLNVMSAFIPSTERIITIEDAAELQLVQEHWARLESRPPNIEGKGAITIRDLFRNTLRMRPDRIIIGECRGAESLDMLQAMNTGHDGSMTTIHANATQDVLSRLDSMVLMSGVELPLRAIREMIASAIDMIVHMARLADGSRKITQITEINGMSSDAHINLRDIFIFNQTGIDENGKVIGEFIPTGYIPVALEEMKIRNIHVDPSIFSKK